MNPAAIIKTFSAYTVAVTGYVFNDLRIRKRLVTTPAKNLLTQSDKSNNGL